MKTAKSREKEEKSREKSVIFALLSYYGNGQDGSTDDAN